MSISQYIQQDPINQIISDEKSKRFYNRIKKYRNRNRGHSLYLIEDHETRYPSREAYYEIEQLYNMFLTPTELRKIF